VYVCGEEGLGYMGVVCVLECRIEFIHTEVMHIPFNVHTFQSHL